MALAQMVIDFKYSNDQAREDMFEDVAERMITAEKALVYKDKTIAALEAENAELKAALQPFVLEKPIGVPLWWLEDFKNARAVLAKYKKA
jgi:hypothetical protein